VVSSQFLYRVSKGDLSFSTRIGVGGVEEIDSEIERSVDDLFCRFVIECAALCQPSTERDFADLQAVFSESAIFHGLGDATLG